MGTLKEIPLYGGGSGTGERDCESGSDLYRAGTVGAGNGVRYGMIQKGCTLIETD